jgi:hypothetical protein
MEVEEASSQMLEIIMAHAVEHEQVAA